MVEPMSVRNNMDLYHVDVMFVTGMHMPFTVMMLSPIPNLVDGHYRFDLEDGHVLIVPTANVAFIRTYLCSCAEGLVHDVEGMLRDVLGGNSD